ncbi:testis-specific serine/threonine-protein kinase 4-like [Liolophura sinensis]|uniref:testis-specific serine/threonine-protein kinase 4-like n=1 Tax=Liolophura sinensis TaxID=3198878 RepID=UPI0031586A0A
MIKSKGFTKVRGRKRKMEPHLGGDNKTVNEEGVQGNGSPLPGGAASGDSHGDEHQFLGLVSKRPEGGGPLQFEIIQEDCPLDDSWARKYTIPLSKLSKSRRFRTGNHAFDKVLPDLPTHGYRPLQILGRSRRGVIFLCQNMKATSEESKECIPVVLKLISRKGKGRPPKEAIDKAKIPTDAILEEAAIHSNIEHSNIVSMLDSFSIRNCSGLILEFCENGHLDQLLRAQDARLVTEPVARKYFHQMHSAIDYLHCQTITHLDICMRNILVGPDGILKLADFGHSKRFTTGDPLFTEIAGSVGYQAPEMLQPLPYNPRLADIWSLGVVLYAMTVGKLPFGCNKNDYLRQNGEGSGVPSPWGALTYTNTSGVASRNPVLPARSSTQLKSRPKQ